MILSEYSDILEHSIWKSKGKVKSNVFVALEITCNADLQYFKCCIHDDGLSGFIHQTKSLFAQTKMT